MARALLLLLLASSLASRWGHWPLPIRKSPAGTRAVRMALFGLLLGLAWGLGAVTAATTTTKSSSTWLVHLHPPIDVVPDDGSLVWTPMARAARRESVHRACVARVDGAQRRVAPMLEALLGAEHGDVHVRPLWIQNVLIVHLEVPARPMNASVDGAIAALEQRLRTALLGLPGVVVIERDHLLRSTAHLDAQKSEADVRDIVKEAEQAPGIPDIDEDVDEMKDQPQRNVRLVHAPELWATGTRGQGVTVADIDSGVRYTHEALADNFRGHRPPTDDETTTAATMKTTTGVDLDYAFWFPPGTNVSQETPDTADVIGHGTHTVGTAVGGRGIGVAPGATWIAARAFNLHGAVSKSAFLEALQWVICPTRVDGTQRNCSLGADIITGSFGVDPTDASAYAQWTWMTPILRVWRAAGTLAVFASGNANGFKCGSVYYPGSRPEAIAVGALIGGSTLWGASGKGPSREDAKTTIKPDFVAPGAAIRSALSAADGSYTRMTGTSMATPHLAGALALLLSGLATSGRNASHEDIVRALEQSTSRRLSKPFLVPSSCGGTRYDVYPNNIYGFGLPNVCAAAKIVAGIPCNSAPDLIPADVYKAVE